MYESCSDHEGSTDLLHGHMVALSVQHNRFCREQFDNDEVHHLVPITTCVNARNQDRVFGDSSSSG